jgi:twitching motility protein PilT
MTAGEPPKDKRHVTLLDSLLDAIIRLDGDALVMHVGEKPYVVLSSATVSALRGPLSWGQVELSSRPLTGDAMTAMLSQMLSDEQRHALADLGAIEEEIEVPGESGGRFVVTAARGGDDVWVEVRRRKATPVALTAPDQDVPVDAADAAVPSSHDIAAITDAPVGQSDSSEWVSASELSLASDAGRQIQATPAVEIDSNERIAALEREAAARLAAREAELAAEADATLTARLAEIEAETAASLSEKQASLAAQAEATVAQKQAALAAEADAALAARLAAIESEAAASLAEKHAALAAQAEAAVVQKQAALAAEAQAALIAKEAALRAEAEAAIAAREAALREDLQRALVAREAAVKADLEAVLAEKESSLKAQAEAVQAAREAAARAEANAEAIAKQTEAKLAERMEALVAETNAAGAAAEAALRAEAERTLAATVAELSAQSERVLAERQADLIRESQAAIAARESELAAAAERALAEKQASLAAEAERALAERHAAVSEAERALAAKQAALAAESERALAEKRASIDEAERLLAARATAFAVEAEHRAQAEIAQIEELRLALAQKEAALASEAARLTEKENALTVEIQRALAEKEAAAAEARRLAEQASAAGAEVYRTLAEKEAALAAETQRTLAEREATLAAAARRALAEREATLAAEAHQALAERAATAEAEAQRTLAEKEAALAAETQRALAEREATLAAAAQRALAEKEAALAAEARRALAEREAALVAESQRTLAEKEAALAAETQRILAEKEAALAADSQRALAEKEAALALEAQRVAEREATLARVEAEYAARESALSDEQEAMRVADAEAVIAAATFAALSAEADAEMEAAARTSVVDPPPAVADASPIAVVTPIARPLKLQPSPPSTPMAAASTEASLVELLRAAAEHGASIVYAVVDTRPMMRISGEIALVGTQAPVAAGDVERFIFQFAPRELMADATPEWTCTIPDVGRVRCVAFHDHAGAGLIFHLPSREAAAADDVSIGEQLRSLCDESDGLIVVAGPRSSGKSALLGAFVDVINNTRYDHVITIESQIRRLHEKRLSFISQREVRGDGDAIAKAARAALREGPDVLVIEDLRAPEALVAALDAARAGRLVFGSISAATAPGAIERLIDAFPADRRSQVRASLAGAIRAVVAQILVPKSAGGRIAAREVLLSSPAVRRVILDGAISQLPIAIESGRSLGMRTMVDAIGALVRDGIVDLVSACASAPDRAALISALERDGIDVSGIEKRA